MTFGDVNNKIRSGDYNNTLKYPSIKSKSDPTFDDEKRAYKQQSGLLQKRFEDDLVTAIMDYTNIPQDKAKKVCNKAWEYGHASGFWDVVYWADELSELVKDIMP